MIALIPARGGSKGLPGKNIKSLCGKPLIADVYKRQITGLSGAGKTTIGNALYYELKTKQDNLIILNGDILKKLVGNSLRYSQSDRKKRAYYYSNL